MLDSGINRIKLNFLLIGGFVVLGMFVGIVTLSSSPYIQSEFIKGQFYFAKYWIEYTGGSKVLAANILSLDKGSQIYENTGKQSAAIPILLYHGLLEDDDGSEGLNITIDEFKRQMFALKRAGYQTVNTEDLLRYMRGEISLPSKSFVLTFDDGRRDSYYNADPIIKALGYEAVMTAISGFSIDTPSDYYLSADELKYMEESGRWDIQAHADGGHGTIPINATGQQGNFFSNKMWLIDQNRLETDNEYAERISGDMALTKSKLENTLGKEITTFAFPFGDFGQGESNFPEARKTILTQAAPIYEILFYQQAPGDHYTANYFNENKSGEQTFLLRRIDYNRHMSDQDFMTVVQSMEAKSLPYSDDFSENKGWISAWGGLEIASNTLTVTPRTLNSGGAAILDGSRHWKDYTVRATVSSPGRNGVYMWIRFGDESNAAACNFGNGFAHIEQTVNGEKRVIKGIRNENINIPSGDFEITARVKGRQIECMLNGEVSVATEFLDESLSQGGIGFKTWAQGAENRLIVKNLEVSEIK